MSHEEDYDIIFKVVLVGDSGVGKSNILLRFIKNEFSFETKATVGVEFGSKKFELENTKIKAQIWDTAGQERYKSITNAYYKGAKGALVVYDITKKETFESIDRWVPELRANGDENISIVLVGNKADLEDQRKVSIKEAEDKARLLSNAFNFLSFLDLAFLETSAYQSINIDAAFDLMIRGKFIFLFFNINFEEIYNKFSKETEDIQDDFLKDTNNAIDLNYKTPIENKKKCCD